MHDGSNSSDRDSSKSGSSSVLGVTVRLQTLSLQPYVQ
jgi:hypothetical protein